MISTNIFKKVPKNTWSHSDKLRAVQMFRAGESITAIGKELNRTPKAVFNVLQRLGYKVTKEDM